MPYSSYEAQQQNPDSFSGVAPEIRGTLTLAQTVAGHEPVGLGCGCFLGRSLRCPPCLPVRSAFPTAHDSMATRGSPAPALYVI